MMRDDYRLRILHKAHAEALEGLDDPRKQRDAMLRVIRVVSDIVEERLAILDNRKRRGVHSAGTTT